MRPLSKAVSIYRQFWSLPRSMQRPYFQNMLDHIWTESNLYVVLSKIFPEKTKNKIVEVVRNSQRSPIIRNIMVKHEEVNGALSEWKLYLLKSILLLLRPRVVVETGVAHGSSSAVILEALSENRCGTLYSIDLPVKVSSGKPEPWMEDYKVRLEDVSTVSDFSQVGWLVPHNLRYKWNLILGDSLVELGPLVQKLDEVNLFLHDSLHLYESMLQEFKIIWPHLKKGGVLLADDIFLKGHAAIHDFAAREQHTFKSFLQMGVILKIK